MSAVSILKRLGSFQSKKIVGAAMFAVGMLFGNVAAQGMPYIITGSGTAFSAAKDGEAVLGGTEVGMKTVIDAIRDAAAGMDCEIQFGNGEDTLHVPNFTDFIDFVNDGTSATVWGNITLSGKIYGSFSGLNDLQRSLITLKNVSVESRANIRISGTSLMGQQAGCGILIDNGTLVISDGEVRGSYHGIRIGNNAVVTVNGGTVLTAGTGTALSAAYSVFIENGGTLNVNGGTVAAYSGDNSRAVWITAGGTLNANGGTISRISSLGSDRSSTVISIGLNAKAVISGSAEITGYINANIGAGIINNNGGVLEILGGTIRNTSTAGYAVYSTSNSGIVMLGGDPIINSAICMPLYQRNLRIVTDGANAFTPSSGRRYALTPVDFVGSLVAVGGGAFASNFTLSVTGYALFAYEGDLFARSGSSEIVYTVSFELDGGIGGAVPADILIVADGRISTGLYPATESFTKAGFINTGSWYTRSGGVYTPFIFGANGTRITSDTTLYLKWFAPQTGIYNIVQTSGTTSEAAYTVFLGGALVGAANMTIGAALDSIRAHAAGADCSIEFEADGDILQASPSFRGAWGRVTLLGNLEGNVSLDSTLESGVTIESRANIVGKISNNSAGTLIVGGGTITNSSGDALYNGKASGSITLGGSPVINGSIMLAAGTVGVTSAGSNVFAPGDKIYTISLQSYVLDQTVVSGGAFFIQNFAFENPKFDLAVSGGDLVAARSSYVISGDGAAFTARKNRHTIIGEANRPISEVMESIKIHAAGDSCVVRFGNDGETLNIGAAGINFGSGWGMLLGYYDTRSVITLTGNITSNNAASNGGTIIITDTVNIVSEAVIGNTAMGSSTIYNNSMGVLTIAGGSITTGASGRGIYNLTGGTTVVSGGSIVTANGRGIQNNGGGRVVILGGTVSATSGNAIHNAGSGRVEIRGGNVSAVDGNAVYNASTGTVAAIGGVISSGIGYALYNRTADMMLGGRPEITGRIGIAESTFGVITDRTPPYPGTLFNYAPDEYFAPAQSDLYTLELAEYVQDVVVVKDAKSFLGNFSLYNRILTSLAVSGDNLILADAGIVVGGFNLAVIGGASTTPSIGGDGYNYEAGTTVSITANSPAAGMNFTGWTSTNTNVTFADAGSLTTTFTMPSSNIAVTANYAPVVIPTYAVTVTGGAGGGNYRAGATVIITAGTAPAGQSFARWESSSAGVEFENSSLPTTTFKMPANAVTVTAIFGTTSSTASSDRVTPLIVENDKTAVVVMPVKHLSNEFTAGPNVVNKNSGAGMINIYRQGGRVDKGVLRVYDGSGNVVNKITISENYSMNQKTLSDRYGIISETISDNFGMNPNKRIVGSWDLRDNKKRLVSDGTYLLRGTITVNGKKEKVSLLVNVR